MTYRCLPPVARCDAPPPVALCPSLRPRDPWMIDTSAWCTYGGSRALLRYCEWRDALPRCARTAPCEP